MSQHPQLSGHVPVECGYFADDEEWRKGWDAAYDRYFYTATADLLVGKCATLYTETKFIERLASHNPDCSIALILRDPVERAFSAYRMEQNERWIDRPFEDVLNLLDDQSHLWNRLFIQFGNYAAGLRRIHEFFPPSQVTVFTYEQFIRDPVQACRDMVQQIGIDATFSPDTTEAHNVHRQLASEWVGSTLAWLRRPDNRLKRVAKRALPPATFDHIARALLEANQGASKPDERMPEHVEAALGEFYRDWNQELERLIGIDLSHWTGMRQAA